MINPQKPAIYAPTTLAQLPDDFTTKKGKQSGYALLTDSQDIESIVSDFKAALDPAISPITQDGITGVMAYISDGDYDAVYATSDSRPWLNEARYIRIA